MEAEVYNDVPLVRLNAPEIFADPAFKEWFFNRPQTVIAGVAYPAPVIATWHRMSEPEFGEYSDFFMLIDFLGGENPVGDGSESDMPSHIWQRILRAVWVALNKPSYHVEAMVWISNLAGLEPSSPEWRLESLVTQLSQMGYSVLHKQVLKQLLDRNEIHIAAVSMDPADMLRLINLGLKILSPSMQGNTACWCLQFDGPRQLLRRNIEPALVPDNVNVEPKPDGAAKPDA